MPTTIAKKSGAPSGDINVSVANLNFKVTDNAPYKTDDQAVVALIRDSYSEFFTIEDAVEVTAPVAPPVPTVPVEDPNIDAASKGGK